MTMNGADALIETLVDNDVAACFANPGTSEMQFVSALDRQPGMRPVLCLFEGVATGAADGYGRMAVKPACTLLHLGPGYGNGLANLHNARRAFTPIVNVIGDHATYHRKFDAPLNSDIAAIVAPNSIWVKSAETPDEVGPLAAEAVSASYGQPGGSASLILPADCAWSPASAKGPRINPPAKATVGDGAVDDIARAMKAAAKPVLLLGSGACNEAALEAAGRIAASGVRVLTDTFIARQPRGAGRFAPDRMQYFGENALTDLAGVDLMVFVETVTPAAFFAYPERPSILVPKGARRPPWRSAARTGRRPAPPGRRVGRPRRRQCPTVQTARSGQRRPQPRRRRRRHRQAHAGPHHHLRRLGDLRPADHEPDPHRPAHDWLGLTGGAIGQGIPVAIGAAVARPDCKVLSLNGDGAAMYTVQGLWTMAREGLDITTIVFANNTYRILGIELGRTGAGRRGRRRPSC